MNVEIGTEAAKIPEKEYINGIFNEPMKKIWNKYYQKKKLRGHSPNFNIYVSVSDLNM